MKNAALKQISNPETCATLQTFSLQWDVVLQSGPEEHSISDGKHAGNNGLRVVVQRLGQFRVPL